MRVLVCGDRNWIDGAAIYNRLAELRTVSDEKDITIIHGAARGADTIAGTVARALGYQIEEFPAEWGLYGKAAGPIRNSKMLDSGIDLVIAFHDHIAASRGTLDTVNKARLKGIPVKVFRSTGEYRL